MNSTVPLDLHWAGRPRSIAAALVRSGSFAAIIDPGPASTLETLRAQLATHGLRVADLQALLLTHIHLDHAGATGSLLKENPRLAVYVHSRGAPHLVDPSKLLLSASRLYGTELERLFGEFLPVPESSVRALSGGEALALGSLRIQVLYSPGHASHHVTYFDSSDGTAFVGDTAGISIEGHPFILPATPPPDISLELWNASLDAIAALHPQRLFLTHYAVSRDPARHLADYRKRLHDWSEIAQKILKTTTDETQAMRRFAREVAAEAAQVLSPEELSHYVFTGGLDLSWLGLARYHRKCAAHAAEGSPSTHAEN